MKTRKSRGERLSPWIVPRSIFTGPVSPQGSKKVVVSASWYIFFDSFYAVHWEAKVIHDDEKLIMIYCIESGAEVHVHKIDVFSKQFCVAQYILHHDELSCSPFRSPETLLASAQNIVMLSIIRHAVCQQAGIQLGECVSQSDWPFLIYSGSSFL